MRISPTHGGLHHFIGNEQRFGGRREFYDGCRIAAGSMSNTTVSDRSLESWLWEAANILRGPVDASDFKAYVFPLLFLKRISDVFDEERAEALDESGGDEDYASSTSATFAQMVQLPGDAKLVFVPMANRP